MNSVLSRSTARSTARIAPGSVESSTCSSSAPSVVAEGAADHLGREARAAHAEQHARRSKPVRLAPPRRTPSARRACSSIFSVIVSQPSRLPISGTPGPPQSVSSLRQTRCGDVLLRRAACTRSAIGGSSSSGIDAPGSSAGRPVTTASRRRSTPAISLSHRAPRTARCPSRSSLSVTSSMSMPASASACERRVGRRPGRPSRRSISAVLGEREQRGHRHRVHGVGATSSSTYFVVGVVRVLDAGRGPQRPLHRRARPRAARAKRSPRKISLKRT